MPGIFEKGPLGEDDPRVQFARETFAVIKSGSPDYNPEPAVEFLSFVSRLPQEVFEPEDVVTRFVHHVLTVQIGLRYKRQVGVAIRDANVMHLLLLGGERSVVAGTVLGKDPDTIGKPKLRRVIDEAKVNITHPYRSRPGYLPPAFQAMFEKHKLGDPYPIPYLPALPQSRG